VAFSDGEGRVHLDNVPVGNLIIRTEAEGFATSTIRRGGVAAGEVVKAARLELAPAFSISGRVVDPQGKPFPQAWVRARHTASPGGEPITQLLGARVEEEGRFLIRNLPAGTYSVEVSVWNWGEGPRYENLTRDGVPAGTEDLLLQLVPAGE
jgi:hypothetical protein